LLAAGCAASSPSDYPYPPTQDRDNSCHARILVTFSSEVRETGPDHAQLQDIATGANVSLTYLRSESRQVYLLMLTTGEPDPDCQRALGRLRNDSRIRSADLDARRQPQ
jgi:hypothetical protein